ncbi:MAG: chemotaxis protein CheW [Phycisphaera sp. RhM]|nr:chemotaxis protein CheW [Phycisphaera sp. RhM]
MKSSPTTATIDWNSVKQRLHDSEVAMWRALNPDAKFQSEVFRHRADQLAKQTKAVRTDDKKLSTLTFKVGEETYAVPLGDVDHIFPDAEIIPVHGASKELAGVANLQGQVRSVIDLRTLLGLPQAETDPSYYIILLRYNGHKLGLRVEQIQGIQGVREESLAHTENLELCNAHHIRGLADQNLILLRVEAFFECFDAGVIAYS